MTILRPPAALEERANEPELLQVPMFGDLAEPIDAGVAVARVEAHG